MSQLSDQSRRIVIVPFISRSGSTYIFNQISRHDDAVVCPEAEVLMNLLLTPQPLAPLNKQVIEKLYLALLNDAKLKHWGLEREDLIGIEQCSSKLAAFCWILNQYAKKTKKAASVVFFKGPRKLLALIDGGVLSAEAGHKLLLMGIIRDGRACYLSQKEAIRPSTKLPMQVSPLRAAQEWCEYVENVERLEQAHKLHLIKYETFIRDPQRALSGILSYTGCDASDELLSVEGDLDARIPISHKAIHSRVAGEADISRVERWRNELSKAEVCLFEAAAINCLKSQGYSLSGQTVSAAVKAIAKLAYGLKDFIWRMRSRPANLRVLK